MSIPYHNYNHSMRRNYGLRPPPAVWHHGADFSIANPVYNFTQHAE